MIGKMLGLVEEIYSNYILLNINNISYIVYIPKRIITPSLVNTKIQLYITHHIYENGQSLYGVKSKKEQQMLEKLSTIKGISYKIAMNIIGNIELEKIIEAISKEEENILKVPGIGPKIAKRIITEMKDFKIEGLDKISIESIIEKSKNNIEQEAISALINLGYGKNEIIDIIQEVIKTEGKSINLNNLITKSLQHLSIKK